MRKLFNRSFLATICLGGCLAATTIQCEVPDIQIITGGWSDHDHDYDYDDSVYIYEDDYCCYEDGGFDWWW